MIIARKYAESPVLCTANRCRSILSQADFNHQVPVETKAFSGGSQL